MLREERAVSPARGISVTSTLSIGSPGWRAQVVEAQVGSNLYTGTRRP